LVIFILLGLYFPSSSYANSLRSFDDIFSNLGEEQKKEAFSPGGIIRSLRANQNLEFLPVPGSGIDLHGAVIRINPSYLAESLLLIPYRQRTLNRLDAYNALGNIRDLGGRLYHSHTRDSEVPLFEEATRIEGGRRNNPVPDPPPSRELPFSETVYIRLRDTNFGNSYYRGDMTISTYGIIYSLTNTRNLSFMLFPVIREGNFIAVLYMEPLVEGMLVYSMAGAVASDFVANMVHIPSAISKRLAVFIAWISDGLNTAR
jgi:hypothetical protein